MKASSRSSRSCGAFLWSRVFFFQEAPTASAPSRNLLTSRRLCLSQITWLHDILASLHKLQRPRSLHFGLQAALVTVHLPGLKDADLTPKIIKKQNEINMISYSIMLFLSHTASTYLARVLERAPDFQLQGLQELLELHGEHGQGQRQSCPGDLRHVGLESGIFTEDTSRKRIIGADPTA